MSDDTEQNSTVEGALSAMKVLMEHAPSELAAPAGSASLRPKTFRESARCPVCLTIGEMRFQSGNYCCDRCDQCWRSDTLGHWMKAFEQGREFERQNDKIQP